MGWRPFSQLAAAWSSWRERRRPPRATVPPVERMVADLQRLAADLDRLERSDVPAKVARMRATMLAYDDTLLALCRALDLVLDGPEVRVPLDGLTRLETEAALSQHGLTW